MEAMTEGTVRAIEARRAVLGKDRVSKLTRELLLKTLTTLDSVSPLGCGWSALRPELVCTDLTANQVANEYAKLFDYDAKMNPNPEGARVPLKSCHAQFFGICCEDQYFERVQCITRNVHEQLRRWNLVRQDLPKLVAFDFPSLEHDVTAIAWLAERVGKGDTQIYVDIERDHTGRGGRLALDREQPVIKTAQRFSGVSLLISLHLQAMPR